VHLTGFGLLAAIAIRTAIVLVLVLVGVRLFGRRQLGELNARDLLVVLIIANAVQNAMTSGDGHLGPALVASGTLLALGWSVSLGNYHCPEIEARLMGTPTVLIRRGQVVPGVLKQLKITRDELMAQIRKEGLAEIEDVELAVMEIDGSISVVPREHDSEGGGDA